MSSRIFTGNDSNFLFAKIADNTNDYYRNDFSGYYLNQTEGHNLKWMKQKKWKNCKNGE